MNADTKACCAGPEARNGGDFDLVVIGAGSAGFSASITAAALEPVPIL